MSELHPAAQAIVERFAARNVSQPHLDKEAVERAIGGHLEALELPHRPARWFADATSAIAHVTLWIESVDNGSEALVRSRLQLFHAHVDSEPQDAAWAAEHAAWTAATVAGKNASWNAASADGQTS